MKRWRSGSVALALAAITGMAGAAEVEQVWETSGFKAPESAVYDAKRQTFYVSNVGGEPLVQDGNGTISRVDASGKLLEAAWIDGLDAPKGLTMQNGRLYTADIDQLVEIDIASGRIVNRYPAEGAKFLNDVTAGANGEVYTSDTQTAAIYRLQDGKLELWLTNEDGELCAPNGLLAERERLIVGCWAAGTGENAAPGRLKAVDYGDKTITNLSGPIGHIDGVEPDGAGGYYLTDWMAGGLWRFEGGEARRLLDLEQGSADLGFVPGQNLIVVPMMMNNSLRAYRQP